ncbi:uncharacterized protein LOC143961279 [Lithobates pipiens]
MNVILGLLDELSIQLTRKGRQEYFWSPGMRTFVWSLLFVLVLCPSASALQCFNGGKYNGFKCECLEDYMGSQCEIIVVRPGQCSFGGDLVDGKCVCKPGFSGPQCEYTDTTSPGKCCCRINIHDKRIHTVYD